MMGGGIHGWLGERALLGENELAGFGNTQQVFLSLMEDDDFPSALHEVNRGNPLPEWIRCRQGRRLASRFWWLCHISLHLPRDENGAPDVPLMIMITVFIIDGTRA